MENHIKIMHNKIKVSEKDATIEPTNVLYKCEECDYSCEKEVNLINHMNTKHIIYGLKKPQCEVVSFKIKDKFYCDECDYSCKAKKSIKKHQEKNHNNMCANTANGECNILSISKSDLKEHTDIIHWEELKQTQVHYNEYPEVEESELDELIAKAAENKI